MTEAVGNSNLLTADEAQLLTSLISSRSEKTLLRKALVTIGNKAAFTKNQVVIDCIQQCHILFDTDIVCC